MILSSNIGEVIGRLKRWQEGLPGAMQRACAPDYWTEQLKMVARATLQAQLAQWSGEVSVDEKAADLVVGFVQEFVDGITGRWNGTIAEYRAVWDEGPVDLNKVLDDMGVVIMTGQYTLDLDPATLEKAKAAVAGWVRNEKILSEQDDYDVEQATERVQRILGLIEPGSPAAVAGWSASTYRQYVAGRLALEVQQWMNRQGGSGRFLTPEIVQQWLGAVLVAWRDYVRLHLRDRIEAELGALTRGIAR